MNAEYISMNIVAIDNSSYASLIHNTDSLELDTSFCEKKLVMKIDINGFYDQGVRRWGVNCLRYLVKKIVTIHHVHQIWLFGERGE